MRSTPFHILCILCLDFFVSPLVARAWPYFLGLASLWIQGWQLQAPCRQISHLHSFDRQACGRQFNWHASVMAAARRDGSDAEDARKQRGRDAAEDLWKGARKGGRREDGNNELRRRDHFNCAERRVFYLQNTLSFFPPKKTYTMFYYEYQTPYPLPLRPPFISTTFRCRAVKP